MLIVDGEGLTAADWAAAGEHRSIEKSLVAAMGKAERMARSVPRGDGEGGDNKRWSLWGRRAGRGHPTSLSRLPSHFLSARRSGREGLMSSPRRGSSRLSRMSSGGS